MTEASLAVPFSFAAADISDYLCYELSKHCTTRELEDAAAEGGTKEAAGSGGDAAAEPAPAAAAADEL